MQALLPSLEEEWNRLPLEREMLDIFSRTEEVSGLVTPANKPFLGEMLYLCLTCLRVSCEQSLVWEDEGI